MWLIEDKSFTASRVLSILGARSSYPEEAKERTMGKQHTHSPFVSLVLEYAKSDSPEQKRENVLVYANSQWNYTIN